MISVMNNNDLGLDRKPRGAEENDVVFDSSNEEIRHGEYVDISDKVTLNVTGSDEIRVSMDNRAKRGDKVSILDGDVDSENRRFAKKRVSDMDLKGIDEKIKKNNQFSDENGETEQLESWFTSGRDTDSIPRRIDSKIDVRNGMIEKLGSRAGKGHVEVGKSTVSQHDSMLSMFDEFATNGRGGALAEESSNPLGYRYEVGDMIWGKVKSHPWWPGHIYSQAFASSPSVRRSKREGHLLVAFFGDSSYGWFDPAELIPFDSNFAEKSRQTSSRTFVKAVEEALDEVNRRRGLGLACRCRNSYNFRPESVQGYFAVDVGDYEPGTIYSANQIRKARDSFQSRETLDFIKQLALSPTSNAHGGIHFMKNKATVLAYRKAVFEEFDETYAQAFGYQPVRPSRGQTQDVGQTLKVPSRAPLSGPLVIAEALGKGKGSAKPNKAKDQANKDRYLFKRRDETNELKTSVQLNPGQTTSSVQAAYAEGSLAIGAGDYVLQKRSPLFSTKHQVPKKHEQTESIARDDASAWSRDVDGKGVTMEDKPAVVEFSMVGSQMNSSKVDFSSSPTVGQAPGQIRHLFEARSSLDKEKDVGLEIEGSLGSDVAECSIGRNASDSVGDMPRTFEPSVVPIDFKDGHPSSTAFKSVEGSEQSLSQPAKVELRGEQAQDCFSTAHPSGTTNAKFHGEGSSMHTDIGAKKAKVRKRPIGELSSEKSIPLEKKKKKKKKRKKEPVSSQNNQMHPSGGKGGSSVGKVAGKSVHVALASREDLQVHHQKKDDKVSTLSLPDSVWTQQMAGIENVELELPQLLHDLQALALNPSHHVERSPAVIRQFFLRFRSVVYQKSLASLPLADSESNETRPSKAPAVMAANNSPAENVRELPSIKPQKPVVRPDNPTKGGRKRGRSDRQEEIIAKKKKKLNDMKLLTVEKKAGHKTLVAQRGDGKETRAPTLKSVKPDPVKKAEPPSRAPDPTMLVMKFPPQGTLPSINELKARFIRFGQLDHSATRVFWKSSTCRVVYRHKADAQLAYRFAVASSNLFGNTFLRCYLRELGVVAPESESDKGQREDASLGTSQLRDSAVERRPAAPLASQPLQQLGIQLKSILKKSTGDETSGNGGGGRGTPRVKFMLGGEETSKGGEQLMVGNKNNFNNNASFADGGASSSSSHHGMDFNSKNFQKFIPPSPLPLLPLPIPTTAVQFPRPPNNLHYTEVAPRNAHNFNTAPPMSLSAPDVDIGQQMISLLTRCNDVVTNVTGLLGYVAYHPL